MRSEALIHLLFEMLAHEPAQRPTASTISNETDRILALYDSILVDGMGQLEVPPNEPVFSYNRDDYVLGVQHYPELQGGLGILDAPHTTASPGINAITVSTAHWSKQKGCLEV